jgi:hypothetical protein
MKVVASEGVVDHHTSFHNCEHEHEHEHATMQRSAFVCTPNH